ncbi:MAG: hypothetical protein ACT4QC_05670 [Planctomycetaceae bacterium]
MRRIVSLVMLAAAFVGVTVVVVRAADDKPKYTIQDVMKEHKRGALKDKVVEGKASDDEKKKLVELYVELGKNKPPKGDTDNWKKLCDALVKAAKDAQGGKTGAADELKKASNCGACHTAHKKST